MGLLREADRVMPRFAPGVADGLDRVHPVSRPAATPRGLHVAQYVQVRRVRWSQGGSWGSEVNVSVHAEEV